MNRPQSILLTSLTALALSGCSWLGHRTDAPEPEEKENTTTQLVGRIATINQEHGFVLTKSIFAWNIPRNTVLTTSGETTAAQICW